MVTNTSIKSIILAIGLGAAVAGGGLFSTGCDVAPAGAVETKVKAATPSEAHANANVAAARSAAKSAASAYAAAAADNARFAEEIQWNFGGRTQRGWALYEGLIAHLVGTDTGLGSPEFALAAADWEKKQGIKPADGRVTLEVWQRMMRTLQSARRNDATVPPDSELVDTDVSDWYDQSRPAELRKLRRDTYDAYHRMVEAARADLGADANGYFRIVSGYRSPEYQAQLRANAGNPSTASLAIHSPHSSGRAIDLYVGGEPVSTADANRAIQVATPAYQWLARNAHRFGFRPYFYEPWHWEYDPRLASK